MDDHLLLDVLRQKTLVIDTRPAGEYAVEHLPGTINIPLNASFVTWAGWFTPYDQDFYLIVDEAAAPRMEEVARALALIGIDRVAGYFAGSAIGHSASHGAALDVVPQITPRELDGRLRRGDAALVDVRSATEFASGHIAAAQHIALGHVPDRLAEIPDGKPIIVQCESGARSAIGASVLRRLGRRDVFNLVGGLSAWAGEGLPVVKEQTHEGQGAHS
jgi:hydroxyacylglutathione hydrolase